MLETLRAYGARLLAEGGEGDAAQAALARYALRVAEEARAGLTADAGEVAAARWLDAEDATMRRALDWALEHDAALGHEAAVAPRLAAAMAWWWQVRGRLAAQVPLLRAAVDRAAAGSDAWCDGHTWLGQASLDSADPAGALRHFTAVRDAIGDRGRFPLLARCLSGRSGTLLGMGRIAEAAGDARRSLALAREGGHPVAEALALAVLSLVACISGDRVGAVQLATQAERISASQHGPSARVCSHTLTSVLIEVGDLAAAERTCAAGLADAREAGDLWSLGNLLEKMVVLNLNRGPLRGRRRAPADSPQDRTADRRTQEGDRGPGLLRVPVRLDGAPRRGGHHMGRGGRAWARGVRGPVASGSARGLVPAAGTTARSPAGARAGSGAGGRGTRHGDEPGGRGRIRSHAHRVGSGAAGRGTGLETLSPRERELVTLVAQGHTDTQIAGQLHISVRTVSSHLDRIRDKTGCRRRADLTRLALSAGLV
jgi:DNA-binding CsgD family transcriptional regulator